MLLEVPTKTTLPYLFISKTFSPNNVRANVCGSYLVIFLNLTLFFDLT